MEHYFCLLEPGLLEELQIRVEAAEQKFKAAELDDHLSEFEVARQRQVKILLKWLIMVITVYVWFYVTFFISKRPYL